MYSNLIQLSSSIRVTQVVNEAIIKHRLLILVLLPFQQPQIVRDIPTIKLSRHEPVAQERKNVLRVEILNSEVLVSGILKQLHEMQSAARVDGRLPILLAVLEPAAARARPCRSLQV